ncbi:MAG TPA: MFS transporter [Ilumatobacteraceae bacterium]|nr:MFS transporter [Ilumatobacteraceae bacterium]HRB02539.1 MFS transporter [Ilumatobacteraceae bacterium]
MSNHPFAPLRHREVRLLWGAAVVSDVGTWVQLIVVGSLVAAGTGSAVQTGLVALATFMPQGIASPVGGLLADRYDRRKVFATALLMQAMVTIVLAIALGMGVRTPAVLTLLILLGSAAGATGAPSYAAMQPDLVPPDQLMAIISLGVYSWNSGRIIGPLLGSVLVLAVGPAWTIGFNALSFVVMAGAVSLVRRPFRPHGADPHEMLSVRRQLVGGWRTMRSTPGCWHGVVLLVMFNLTVAPFMGLIPIYVSLEFGGGTGLTGAVASAQGIGAILGGIAITLLAARHRRSYLLARLVFALSLALWNYALAPNTAWLIVGSAVVGACSTSMFITSSAIIQRDAPSASRGRVMSIMQAAMGISYGIGLLFIGAIGDATSLRVAFAFGATLLVVSFGLLTLRSRNWQRAIDDAEVSAIDRVDAGVLSVACGD